MRNWRSKNKNRKAAVAGKFYPEVKQELEKEMGIHFSEAKKRVETLFPLQALISPHAGYVFSGKVAASAFNQLPENAFYERIFVLASSHQYAFNGATIYTQGNYETPLGEIEVDQELGEKLTSSSAVFKSKPEAHEHEHSLEVQLPFLQYKLKKSFKLIPIILGTNNADDCAELAKALRPYFTPKNLFIVSTDFSHFPDYEAANKLDLLTVQSICKNKPTNLLATLKNNKNFSANNLATSLCGWTSVLTLLYLTEGENFKYSEIDYQNSGDAKNYGDKKRVVGYGAIAVYSKTKTFVISDIEKEELLDKAKTTITEFIKTGERGTIIPTKTQGILNEVTGAFVSIYVNDELRGCIGGFAQEKSLNELVQEMAISALGDRRFEKLRLNELANMKLEISVLSPLKRIKFADEIVLGKHGIYIKSGYNTGTFLPQVAEKTDWTVNELLGHCSRDKAGLGWEGWKTAELFTYEAIVVCED